jgi:O-acetyl-ADP-ribose deacetylase (regulator of RNase III)
MIEITQGDVTDPQGSEVKVIVHCVNDVPCMGAGVALAISKKWPHTREAYMEWGQGKLKQSFKLGDILIINAEPGIHVCHLIGQKDVGGEIINNVVFPPVRYEAIREGMLRLAQSVRLYQGKTGKTVSIHAPLLGCDLAGGELSEVYKIVNEIFGQSETKFTFYAFSDEHMKNLEEIHENVREKLVGFIP